MRDERPIISIKFEPAENEFDMLEHHKFLLMPEISNWKNGRANSNRFKILFKFLDGLATVWQALENVHLSFINAHRKFHCLPSNWSIKKLISKTGLWSHPHFTAWETARALWRTIFSYLDVTSLPMAVVIFVLSFRLRVTAVFSRYLSILSPM